MIAVMVVSDDMRWRNWIEAALPAASVFVTSSEADAVRRMRRIEIDLVIYNAEPDRSIPSFSESVREVAPACVTIAVLETDTEDETADFTVRSGDPSRSCEAVLKRAAQKSRLVHEVATLRDEVTKLSNMAAEAEEEEAEAGPPSEE